MLVAKTIKVEQNGPENNDAVRGDNEQSTVPRGI